MIKLFDDFIKKFSVNLGLIEGKTIYWDGTFLKANCNNHKKMYPTQILFLESFIKKHYGDYLNNESNIWEMLRNYYYNDHMYAEELQEILLQLKHNINHHGIHLLKNAVLTDMNANKIIKRLEHMKKNIP